MTETDIQVIREVFTQQLGVFAEGIQHKLDLVVEGQQMLSDKLDATRDELKADIARVDHRLTVVETRLDHRIDEVVGKVDKLEGKVGKLERKFDKLESKVDGIAVDLAAHRKDTEAHAVYRVGE